MTFKNNSWKYLWYLKDAYQWLTPMSVFDYLAETNEQLVLKRFNNSFQSQ